MNIDEISAAEKRIRSSIDRTYCDPDHKSHPIYDGVISPELYCNSSPRIMWILKEPWDGENSTGGGWSLCSDLLASKRVSELGHHTFHPIIYIAYGLYNNKSDYDYMPWVRDMPDAESILRSIALINAKKLPGVTRGAYSPTILKWYRIGRDIINEQIDAYRPDIVFGCSPHMPEILDARIDNWRDKIRSSGSASFVTHNNMLYVHVHHPGQSKPKLTRKIYVEDALQAVALARESKTGPGHES